MKAIKELYGLMLAGCLLSAGTLKLSAQENNWVNNGFFSNSFVDVSASANILWEANPLVKGDVKAGFNAHLGKWHSPWFATRLGFSGIDLSDAPLVQRVPALQPGVAADGRYHLVGNYYYIHSDLMWDWTNTFGGYKADRVWRIAPYVHFGAMLVNSYDKQYKNFDWAYGIGLWNSFRLSPHVAAIVDVRASSFSRKLLRGNDTPFLVNASVGLNVDFGTNTWKTASDASAKSTLVKDISKGWFIQTGGGVTLAAEGGNKGFNGNVAPSFEVAVGKWFSPYFGARAAWQAGTFSQWLVRRRPGVTSLPWVVNHDTRYLARLNYSYIHADLLWNLNNTFADPSLPRVVDVIPYIHTGLLRTDKLTGVKYDNTLAAGAGMLLNFRLDQDCAIYFDGRATLVNGRAYGSYGRFSIASSAQLGLQYSFGGDNWRRPEEADKDVFGEKQNPHFALSTNLISWAMLGTINLGAQYEVGQHFTLEGKVKFNPWTFNLKKANQFEVAQQSFSFGARYWPWYAFSGFWLSAAVQAKNYRVGGMPSWLKMLNEEGSAYGASIGLGYSIMVNSWMNVDLGLSGWGGYKQCTRYADGRFTQPTGICEKWFLAPDDVTIALVFLF